MNQTHCTDSSDLAYGLRHETVPDFVQALSGSRQTKGDGRPPVALVSPLQCEIQGRVFAKAGSAGLKLILWHTPTGDLSACRLSLWNAARSGIWNHLTIGDAQQDINRELLRFAGANPNVVHSWSISDRPDRLGTPVPMPPDPALFPFSRLTPLLGRPLWQTLEDPIELLHCLDRFGLEYVLRRRVTGHGNDGYRLGANLDYHFVTPDCLPEGYLDIICRMVEAGGSVGPDQVRDNLKRAFLIGYVVENDRLVGNSSLKRPRTAYIQTLNQHTGLDFSHYLERGYTSVRPEYRGLGIGTRLLKGLTERAGRHNIFSIISEDNTATQTIALRNRTRKVGTFFSDKLGKRVGVWVPAPHLKQK